MNLTFRTGCAALVLSVVMVGSGQAWAGKLTGSWRGGGTLVTLLGEREAVRCRVKIRQRGKTQLKISAKCAATSGKANQTLILNSVARNKFAGAFQNAEHNTSGYVTLTVRGSRISMHMTGNDGTASVSLRR